MIRQPLVIRGSRDQRQNHPSDFIVKVMFSSRVADVGVLVARYQRLLLSNSM